MSQKLFSAGLGVEILSADFTSRVQIITGSGEPGVGADHIAAPMGSIYLRQDAETDGLQIYFKSSVSNSSTADWSQTTDKKYVDAIAKGLSWREPVRVMDSTTYADIAALPVLGIIDGVTLVDGDRVLFADITGDPSNVYVWNAGNDSWSEDANAITDGDAILIQEGTNAEQQWVYDGVNWVQFGGAASNAELAFIRNFIGKTGVGAETPTYSSVNNVTTGQTLEVAIGDLDAAIGDRAYTTTGVLINDGESIATSIDALSVALGTLQYTNEFSITNGESHTASVDALDLAIGDRNYASGAVIVANESVASSLVSLDSAVDALQVNNLATHESAVTTARVIDSVPLAFADNVEWSVVAENASSATNRQSTIINALHNGTTVDYSSYASNKHGPSIAGLDITVVVNGANMELVVSSSTSVDVGARRRFVLTAN